MISSVMNAFGRVQSGGLGELEAMWAEFQFRISAKKRAKVLTALSRLVARGKPLDKSIQLFKQQYENSGMPIAAMYGRWASGMAAGDTFSDVVKGSFSDMEHLVISAGDESGTLASALEEAATLAQHNATMTSTIAAASAMPVGYLAMLLGVCIGFATGFGPELQRTIPASALTENQRTTFAVAEIIARWWPVALAGIGAFLAWSYWSLANVTGTIRDKYLDRLPPWSIYKSFSSASLMISLAAMVRAGMPMDESVKYIRTKAKPWLAHHLLKIVRRNSNAMAPAKALDVGLIDREVMDLVAVYASEGDFDEAMSELSKDAIEVAIESIKVKAGVVKTVAIVLTGAVVFQGFSVIMGLSNAQNNASKMQGTQITQKR